MFSTTIRLTGVPEGELSVRELVVTEAMSALFAIDVVAVSRRGSLDFERITGAPAALRILDEGRGALREWQGVCRSIAHVRVDEEGLSTYEIAIAPSLWRLTQSHNRRIFVGSTAPQIAESVLSRWGVEHRFEIDAAAHPPLELRTQLDESDYRFLCRILEEASIAFYFERAELPGGPATRLVLCDAPEARAARAPIQYVSRHDPEIRTDYVTRVEVLRRVRPGRVTHRDFDFRRPAFVFERADAGPSGSGEEEHEQYVYAPGSFVAGGAADGATPVADGLLGAFRAQEPVGASRSRRAREAEEPLRRRVRYQSSALDLAPGVVFSIVEHPRPDLGTEARLLVTDARLSGNQNGIVSASGEAVFADTPYRPPRVTPKPRARAVSTGMVVAAAGGQEIETDEFGRVLVALHWAEAPTCWLRVSQAWAGAGYGMLALPRVGHEVLVGFLDDDPDQPIVIGRVHNGRMPAAYPLPESKTKSVWRSRPSPPRAGGNEISMDDRKGAELVAIQAERNLQKEVLADEIEETGHDRTIDVAGELRIEARGNLILRAKQAVIIDGGPNVRLNCKDEERPMPVREIEPKQPGPPGAFANLLATLRLSRAGQDALAVASRLDVRVRLLPPGLPSAGFDPASRAVLVAGDAGPAAQALHVIAEVARAERLLLGAAASLRRAYLPADELAERLIDEEARTIALSIQASHDLESAGVDMRGVDVPMREEAERARAELGPGADVAAIAEALRGGGITYGASGERLVDFEAG